MNTLRAGDQVRDRFRWGEDNCATIQIILLGRFAWLGYRTGGTALVPVSRLMRGWNDGYTENTKS